MITRHTIATVLTTTAIVYSICIPAQAAGLASVTSTSTQEPVTEDRDRGLQNEVKAALGADDGMQGSYVAVAARDGHVTLSGVVLDAAQLARALQTAMAVPGVRQVDNALEVEGR